MLSMHTKEFCEEELFYLNVCIIQNVEGLFKVWEAEPYNSLFAPIGTEKKINK